jgi:hypothetical protein
MRSGIALTEQLASQSKLAWKFSLIASEYRIDDDYHTFHTFCLLMCDLKKLPFEY